MFSEHSGQRICCHFAALLPPPLRNCDCRSMWNAEISDSINSVDMGAQTHTTWVNPSSQQPISAAIHTSQLSYITDALGKVHVDRLRQRR